MRFDRLILIICTKVNTLPYWIIFHLRSLICTFFGTYLYINIALDGLWFWAGMVLNFVYHNNVLKYMPLWQWAQANSSAEADTDKSTDISC